MMITETARVEIRFLATHQDPDVDDVEAMRLLRRHGKSIYPGIGKSRIITSPTRTPWDKSVAQLEAEGILCIGIAGSRFDEHPHEGQPHDTNECATTLVARHLGIIDRPSVQANIGYALEKNYSAKTDEWEIAPLIKLAFRHGPKTSDHVGSVFTAAFLFLNAAEAHEASLHGGKALTGTISMTVDQIVAGWLMKTFGNKTDQDAMQSYYAEAAEKQKSLTTVVAGRLGKHEDATLKFILNFGASNRTLGKPREKTSFLLADLVYDAQRQLCVSGDLSAQVRICEAVEIFLRAVWLKDTNFHENCRADFLSPNTRHEVLKTGSGKMIKITSVVSNNPEIGKFCRSRHGGHSTVVIKRTPETGNTQVFFDQKFGLDPQPVVAALRTAERQKRGITTLLPYEALVVKGVVEGAEVWYFDGFQIMNGSLTAEVPPTALRRSEVEAIVLRSLKDSLKAKRLI